jgi:hypothetical protein
MALTQVEIPSKGGVLKPQDEATPAKDQGRTGHLPCNFQERRNLLSEGIGNEPHGMNPVIHGPKLHSVPWGNLDVGGDSVLLGSSTPQSDVMNLGTGG